MKSPLIHLVIALIIGILAMVAYGFWYSAVSRASQHVVALQTRIDQANTDVSRIAAARAALAEISNDEASVQGYFVPESGVVAFINTLEGLGPKERAEVSVLSVSTAGSAAQPTLLLALSVAGSFDSVMRTIGAVEYAPYDLSITKLTLVQNDKNLWQANLSLTVGSAPASATSTPHTSP
jgi:Tfp pilus assembly protein PilE